MKKLQIGFLATAMLVFLGGCANKDWSDQEIKEHFEEADYRFACSTSTNLKYCSFMNTHGYLLQYTQEDGIVFTDTNNLTTYDVKNDKIITGNVEKDTMKKVFHEILASTDISEEQLTTLMKKEYDHAYQ